MLFWTGLIFFGYNVELAGGLVKASPMARLDLALPTKWHCFTF